MLSPRQFSGLVNDLRSSDPKKGGFTVDINAGEHPDSGFSVAQYGHEEIHPESSAEDLSRYVHKKEAVLSQPGKHFGGWRNKGSKRDYLDVASVYHNTAAGETQARLGAMVNNQEAYYHFNSGDEEWNPSHEEDTHPAQGRRLSRMSGQNVRSHPPSRLPRIPASPR